MRRDPFVSVCEGGGRCLVRVRDDWLRRVREDMTGERREVKKGSGKTGLHKERKDPGWPSVIG